MPIESLSDDGSERELATPANIDPTQDASLSSQDDAVKNSATRNWQDYAACSPDGAPSVRHLFFPPYKERPQSKARREAAAAVICSSCPVINECRDYARQTHQAGFWGGENDEARNLHNREVPFHAYDRRTSQKKLRNLRADEKKHNT